MVKIFQLFILFFLTHNALFSQGLQFFSNNKLIAERTSYHVFHNKTEVFKGYIELEFDISIIDPSSFGYILYIEDTKNGLFYNLTYTNENDSLSYFKLSVESKSTLLSIPINKSILGYRKWYHTTIKINSVNDSISINFNNKTYHVKAKIPNEKLQPEIYFGKHESFIDVPEMAIKNLMISGKSKRYFFPFNEINGNKVHNLKGKNIGHVENPMWLINESYYWKLRQRFQFSEVTAISYDDHHHKFNIINKDSLIQYSPTLDNISRLPLNEDFPVPMRLGTSFFDSKNQHLYIYEVNDVDSGISTAALVDMHTLSIKKCCSDQLKEQRHHHVSYLDIDSGQYWIFGGFGNKHFSNEFYSFSLNTFEWKEENFQGDFIPPRFFSGLTAFKKNELILFGGVGNPSGDQTLGKIYYTDCYHIDLERRIITKRWELNDFKERMVSGRNMIMAPDSAHFYTLYYNEYTPNTFLNVYQFSIKNGDYVILGDSIPMVSERIRTNANLYFNNESNEIYCVAQEFKLDGSSQVNIYSISNPPVSEQVFFQEDKTNAKSTKTWIISLLASTLLAGVLLYVFVLRARKRGKLKKQRQIIQNKINSPKKTPRPTKNAVYLFGNFKAYDNKGRDISHLFSPKIKQLFVLILLNSNKEKITSNNIYQAIWPDRPADKAKNSKGVTLNQLRKILIDIDQIELKSDNKLLYFDLKKDFYCDYSDFKQQMEIFHKEASTDEKLIEKLIAIVAQGRFLRGIENDYFDSYKDEFETEVLKIIPYQLETSFKGENYIQVIQIAKILYNIDLTNEMAFHYELLSYLKLDMVEKAKKRYNAFIVDFKKEQNDDYAFTFRELSKYKSLELLREKSFI